MQFVTKFVCKFCHAEVCLQSVQSLSAALQSLSCRGCAEAAQGLCRGCAGAMQRLYSGLHSGCTVAAQWLHSGCAEAVQRLCIGCAEAAQCLCRGCAEAVQRLCKGCASAVQRLCRGCAEAAYRQTSVDKVCHTVDKVCLLQTRFVIWWMLQTNSWACRQTLSAADLQTNFVSRFCRQTLSAVYTVHSTQYTVYSTQTIFVGVMKK